MTDRLLWLLLLPVLAPLVPAQDVRPILLGADVQELTRSERLVVFEWAPEASLPLILEAEVALVDGLDEELVDRRVAVVRARRGAGEALVGALRERADVRWADAVHHLGDPALLASRYLPRPDVVVRFRGGVDAAAVASRHGARVEREIAWLPGAWVLRAGGSPGSLDLVDELLRRPDVVFAHVDWLRRLEPREVVPNDPLFPNQWHLKNVGQGGGLIGLDTRATFAWDHTLGSGRVIAVIDTGVSVGHADLLQTAIGYNPVTGAGPTAGNDVFSHGTSVAGVAAATGLNGTLVAGIAPAAKIMPIRLLTGSGYGTPTEEANCFIWATDNGADVINCSWGPDGVPFPLPTLVEMAMIHALTVGRGGRGTPIFWASGNGNESVALDAYVSSAYTIAVGAVTNLGFRAAYSDYGAALDLVAPSSGGSRSINTLVPGNSHTLAFGGTSAAAPQGAGVAALMIAVAPDLGWIQIRDILRSSAQSIQPTLAAYDAQGHSLTYGYGLLDAKQAVLDALATLPPPVTLSITTTGVGDIVVDLDHMGSFHEWVIGFSTQLLSPIGSGPLFGVGFDALMTFLAPFGLLPFHGLSDVTGRFLWGAVGVPPGLTVQAVGVEITPTFQFHPSNAVQVAF